MAKKDPFMRWIKNPKSIDWADVKKYIEEGDTLSAIITAHSHIEIILRMGLNTFAGTIHYVYQGVREYSPKSAKDFKNYSFFQILQIANYFSLVDNEMYSKLYTLNQIRNDWAHSYLFKEELNKSEAENIALKSEKYIPELITNLGKLSAKISSSKVIKVS